MSKLRITYNAPVVLTFAILATAVHGFAHVFGEWWQTWFATWPNLDQGLKSYTGLVTHVLGHGNWDHLLGNFTMILLLGPILEERHGSSQLFFMIVITALVTGVVNLLFFSTVLIGASGIVFMMIILASTTNIEKGEIPLTFLAISLLFFGREIMNAFDDDRISQMAHIVGGIVGAVFGFVTAGSKAKGKLAVVAPGAGLAKPLSAAAKPTRQPPPDPL